MDKSQYWTNWSSFQREPLCLAKLSDNNTCCKTWSCLRWVSASDIATLIGIEFDENTVWGGQLTVAQGRRICEIVCVQNHYNLVHREDDTLINDLARNDIAYVPYFPLGGFNPLQSSTLSDVAARLDAKPMQVALAWLLRHAPNILLIPGASSVAHLQENLGAAECMLPDDAVRELNRVADIGSI